MKKTLSLAIIGLSLVITQGVSYADCISVMPMGRSLVPQLESYLTETASQYMLPDGYFKLQSLTFNTLDWPISDDLLAVGTGSCSDSHNQNNLLVKLESQVNNYMDLIYTYFQNNNITTDYQKSKTLTSIFSAICERYGLCGDDERVDVYDFGDNLTWGQVSELENYNENVSPDRYQVIALYGATDLYKGQLGNAKFTPMIESILKNYRSSSDIGVTRSNDSITLTAPADQIEETLSSIRVVYVSSPTAGVNIAQADLTDIKMQVFPIELIDGNYVVTLQDIAADHYYSFALVPVNEQGVEISPSDEVYVGLE